MLDLILLLYKGGERKGGEQRTDKLIHFIKRKECVNDEWAMGPAKDRKKSSGDVNCGVTVDVNERI